VTQTPISEKIILKEKLPDGWRLVQLGEICEIIAGQSPPGDTYRKIPEGLPFFQGKADFGKQFPTPRTWCVSPTIIALPGDILISVRAPVGPTNIADRKCCIGRGLAAIRPGDRADRDFILAGLRIYESVLVKLGSGSTFSAINRKDLETIKIPLPPLAEQKRIAAILNEQMAAVDRARVAANAQLMAVKKLRAAYLREIFVGLEGNSWPCRCLKDILADTRNGLYKPDEYYGSGVPILKMFNIGRLDGTWNLERVDRIRLTTDEEETYRLEKDDILLNRVNSRELVGKCAVVDATTSGAVFESKNMRLRVIRNIAEPFFVAIWLNSVGGRRQIESRLKQIVGQATVNRSDLDSIEIPLPPIPKQRIILNYLSKIMEVADRGQKAAYFQHEEINKLPAALLRRAFNGEM
jgi:type I restriction enzyme S subunit